MTTITALPTAPQRSDPTNFPARADAWITQFTNTTVNEINTTLTAMNSAQTAAALSQTNAATSEANALGYSNASNANAVAAAASAGAALWVSGNTYANGVAVRSPANQRLYIKITATAGGAVDPSANATDWALLNLELPTIEITTATYTLVAGYRYLISYAGACAMTAPATPTNLQEFVVVPVNGRLDNTIDFGAKTVQGPNGSTQTGVITMDVGPMRPIYVTSVSKWGMQ